MGTIVSDETWSSRWLWVMERVFGSGTARCGVICWVFGATPQNSFKDSHIKTRDFYKKNLKSPKPHHQPRPNWRSPPVTFPSLRKDYAFNSLWGKKLLFSYGWSSNSQTLLSSFITVEHRKRIRKLNPGRRSVKKKQKKKCQLRALIFRLMFVLLDSCECLCCVL